MNYKWLINVRPGSGSCIAMHPEKIKVVDTKFADIPAGATMYIAK
jgi:hypothetical protein